MKKLFSLLALSACLGMASRSHAVSILWVSDNGLKGTVVGSDGVTRGAFYPAVSTNGTPFVDQGFVDLLISAGHTVTRYNPNPTTMSIDDVPVINNFDLVIGGAALNSGPFNLNARGPKWNTLIKAPMIYTKSTLVRRDRAGFLLDNKEYDCAADASVTASGKLTLLNPSHPIFQGIARTTVGGVEVMDNHSVVRVANPPNNRGASVQYFRLLIDGVDQGISNDVEPGGVVLATIDFNPMDPGVNIPAGQAPAPNGSYVATGYAIVEWPEGTVVRSTQAAGETIAGFRLLFACGTRDASGSVTAAPNPQAGALDLSADGQAMFLKAVNYAAAKYTRNTWKNTTSDFAWNSPNWTEPTIWADDAHALFTEVGAGTVTLSVPVSASKLEFSAPGYSVVGAGNVLTLTGDAAGAALTANAPASIAASIAGDTRVTVMGSSVLTLEGDATTGAANTFTGGTYVRSGTLVLKAVGVATSGSSYAVGNIEAIDPGATVKIGTVNDGAVNTRPADGQVLRTATSGRLNLTGGVFDNNGDDNGLQYPPPEGFGTILNSSVYKRAVLKIQRADGGVYLFNGQITDGGPNATTSQGVAHQQNVDMNGGNYTLILGGSNSFTGFIRLNSGSGNTIILTNNGTLGYPPTNNAPARHILMNSGKIDLNGTSQKVGYVFTGNDANSQIVNTAFGTVSTLTVCFNSTNLVPFNGAATPRGIRSALLDDPENGGTLALTKEGIAIQPIGNYPGDGTPAQNNYHGDTTVNDGILQVLSINAVSPNSVYRLNTTKGVLQLDYDGSAPVKGLVIDGVEYPNGAYGAGTGPIQGSGALEVTGSTSPLLVRAVAGGYQILWNGAALESTSDLNQAGGGWQPVTGAQSPHFVPAPAEAHRFFRVRL